MASNHDWQTVHQQLLELSIRRSELDAEEGPWLLAALRQQVHKRLGYGSFQEYIERLFGYGPRFVTERLRVAHSLESLPLMAQALRSGELCWSAARELTRVASAQTEQAWLAAAQNKTLRELERLVVGRQPGDEPSDPRDPRPERHMLRLELSAETWATYREAVAKLRSECDEPFDEETALLLMARQVLIGPADAGRAGYQIALTVCESCGRASQQGRGEQIAVGREVAEMAACDAQVLPREVDAAPVGARVTGGVVSDAADDNRRATQSIPPRVRRQVIRRAGGRCEVPGCRHAVFLDIHHVVPRADGGQHDPATMAALCGAHHRALHRGTLTIDGTAHEGFRFSHADGSNYGGRVHPASAQTGCDVFLGLRSLGFGETQARQALEAARASLDPSSRAKPELLLRAALQALTPRHCSSQPRATTTATSGVPARVSATEVREPRAPYDVRYDAHGGCTAPAFRVATCVADSAPHDPRGQSAGKGRWFVANLGRATQAGSFVG
jgi:hypothetical protein